MRVVVLTTALFLTATFGAEAADPEGCRAVRFSDFDAPEILLRTAAVAVVLEAMGYEPEAQPLSRADSFAALGTQDIDILLGVRLPEMAGDFQHYRDLGGIELLAPNAGPALQAAASAVPASEGQSMPATAETETAETETAAPTDSTPDAPAADETELVPTSPPPPAPGDYTVTRTGYAEACPNIAKLLGNLEFPTALTDEMAGRLAETGDEPFDAAVFWFRRNRTLLERWLDDVQDFDGGVATETVVRDLAL